jgi:hypothetical protein
MIGFHELYAWTFSGIRNQFTVENAEPAKSDFQADSEIYTAVSAMKYDKFAKSNISKNGGDGHV